MGALGASPGRVDPKGRAVYVHNKNVFMLSKPTDGGAACGANGGTIGFVATTTEDADAFHKAGLENGGAAIEGPPGWRESNGRKLYLAYLKDPSGSKICAVARE